MTNNVMLNNVDHQELRVIGARGAQYGDQVRSCVTFPLEFRDVQAHYPIVFSKSEDGVGFEPQALFGLQEDENLYLGPNGWDAPLLPMAMERLPFLIGRTGNELNVHIDLDSPRVSRSEGEPLFLPYGGSSPYLERIGTLLQTIHDGLSQLPAFIAALVEHELLESFVADIELADGSSNRLFGYYTINEDRLHKLSGAALERLNRDGHLQSIFMVMASLSNFRGLVDRKQRAINAHG